jgi:hypothetical protein
MKDYFQLLLIIILTLISSLITILLTFIVLYLNDIYQAELKETNQYQLNKSIPIK